MDNSHWIEITVSTSGVPAGLSEVIMEVFTELCGGTEITGDTESNSIIKAYVADNDSGKIALAQIRSRLSAIETRNHLPEDVLNISLATRKIKAVDWAANWKQYYRPQRIGEHFVVYPSWQQPEDIQPDDKLILLDPGQAFGTGQHETTMVCLEIMESLSMADWRIADVGCGSGILSIGAKMLGAGEIHGVDIDPVATETAKENLEKNSIAAGIHIQPGSVRILAPQGPFDLVIANIISEVLLNIGEGLRDITRKNGLLIWSGIIADQVENMEGFIESIGLTIREKMTKGDWYGYLLERSG